MHGRAGSVEKVSYPFIIIVCMSISFFLLISVIVLNSNDAQRADCVTQAIKIADVRTFFLLKDAVSNLAATDLPQDRRLQRSLCAVLWHLLRVNHAPRDVVAEGAEKVDGEV